MYTHNHLSKFVDFSKVKFKGTEIFTLRNSLYFHYEVCFPNNENQGRITSFGNSFEKDTREKNQIRNGTQTLTTEIQLLNTSIPRMVE